MILPRFSARIFSAYALVVLCACEPPEARIVAPVTFVLSRDAFVDSIVLHADSTYAHSAWNEHGLIGAHSGTWSVGASAQGESSVTFDGFAPYFNSLLGIPIPDSAFWVVQPHAVGDGLELSVFSDLGLSYVSAKARAE